MEYFACYKYGDTFYRANSLKEAYDLAVDDGNVTDDLLFFKAQRIEVKIETHIKEIATSVKEV